MFCLLYKTFLNTKKSIKYDVFTDSLQNRNLPMFVILYTYIINVSMYLCHDHNLK